MRVCMDRREQSQLQKGLGSGDLKEIDRSPQATDAKDDDDPSPEEPPIANSPESNTDCSASRHIVLLRRQSMRQVRGTWMRRESPRCDDIERARSWRTRRSRGKVGLGKGKQRDLPRPVVRPAPVGVLVGSALWGAPYLPTLSSPPASSLCRRTRHFFPRAMTHAASLSFVMAT